MGNCESEVERLVLEATGPTIVSIAADELVLEQNSELRECLAGRLVTRRAVELADGEMEFVGFYHVPSDLAGRKTVIKWFWSAEQLRFLAHSASPAFVDELPAEVLGELASASDRVLPRAELARKLRGCDWAVLHDHSEGTESICIVSA